LAAGMGVGLYAGWLIREYIRYLRGSMWCVCASIIPIGRTKVSLASFRSQRAPRTSLLIHSDCASTSTFSMTHSLIPKYSRLVHTLRLVAPRSSRLGHTAYMYLVHGVPKNGIADLYCDFVKS